MAQQPVRGNAPINEAAAQPPATVLPPLDLTPEEEDIMNEDWEAWGRQIVEEDVAVEPIRFIRSHRRQQVDAALSSSEEKDENVDDDEEFDYSREWRQALQSIRQRRYRSFFPRMTHEPIDERVSLRPGTIEAIVRRWPTPGALIRELQHMPFWAVRFEIQGMLTREYDRRVRCWCTPVIGQDQEIAITHFVYKGAPSGIRELLAFYGESRLLPSTVQ